MIRRIQWNILDTLQPNSRGQWICEGDFSTIHIAIEKRGGRQYPFYVIKNFRQMIDNCNLMDLGFQGTPFTWCNKQQGRNRIHSRLDRVLCNATRRICNTELNVKHLPTLESDHKIILLMPDLCNTYVRRPFRFEVMCTTNED